MTTIAVLSMGGTVESLGSAGQSGVAPSQHGSGIQLLVESAMSGLIGGIEVSVTRVGARESGTLTFPDIFQLYNQLLALAETGVDGLLVTTGTDTLEEVSFTLDLLWDRDTPLVVTGSMRHLEQPGSDAAANVRAAILVAANAGAASQGCLVVLSGEIHHAWQVRKEHSSKVSAFTSHVTGPVGSVAEDIVRITHTPIARPLFDLPLRNVPPIALLKASMGDDGRILKSIQSLGFDGLVIECMGGGSVHPDWVRHLRTLTAAMPIVYASRTGGPTLTATYGGDGSEIQLRAVGLLPAGFLDGVHARILLSLLVASRCSKSQIAQALSLFDLPEPGGKRLHMPPRSA